MTAKDCYRPALLLAVLAVGDARADPGPSVATRGGTHWAFRPTVRPIIPQVRQATLARSPVDAFLLSALEAKGLTFSPEADRATLLRRAYLDLCGLPPSPEEADAFLADGRPDAFERLLDRLLASPRFGERWGRHWLDVAGYADTVGFDVDATTVITSEGKWRYRDYVLAAFNADRPYDRFVTEQLAGDELVDWRNAEKYTPRIRELLIATGYLRTARDLTHEPESNIPLNHFNVLHDTVAIVGNSLLGLTLGCAQCHDHKFDPVSQKDYYRLMAAFTPAYNPRDWRPVFPWKREIRDRGLPDVSAAEVAEVERHNREVEGRAAALKKQLAELRRPCEERLLQARLQTLPEAIRADTRAAVATPPAKRNEVQKYLAGKFEAFLRVTPEQVRAAFSAPERPAVDAVEGRLAAVLRERQSFGKIQALYDVGPPPPTRVLKRGNHETPGAEVEPGFLVTLTDPSRRPPTAPSPVGTTSGRRSALAAWLTEPDTPASALLARVMVNRLWQHLFGRGLVATPENFGLSGEAPTHPELLEWLAAEFARGGWRVKPMLRLMMASSAYRQESRSRGETGAEKVDPGNHLLWRMRLRRLEAEAVRDSILAVSGRLDLTTGGPPVPLRAQADGMVVVDDKALSRPADGDRRSVYLLARRAYNLSLLTVFDQPLVAVNCPSRDASAVPLQSLTMLNDAFVARQARHFARRVASLTPSNGEGAARVAFRLALVRQPAPAELAVGSGLLARHAETFRRAGRTPREAQLLALEQLCHTLLNTSEFLYAE